MENKKQLNNLVLQSQQGCKKSLDKLFKIFIPIIEKESENIWYKIDDVTKFETRCYRHLESSIKNFKESSGDFINLVFKSIAKERSDFLNRRKSRLENVVSIEVLANQDGTVRFDVKDEEVDIENDLITKEKISALAREDIRRFSILSHWADGLYCETTIAKLLAQRYGGKIDSHRKFIRRFRIECQKTLSQVS